jgi:hypothetical protein
MDKTLNFRFFRLAIVALLATVVSAGLLSAEDTIGTFTLPFEAKWGQAILPAGDYSFKLNTASYPSIATVRQGQRSAAFIMANAGLTRGKVDGPSALIIVRRGRTGFVRALRLAEVGATLEYLPPKGERQMLAQGPVLIQRIAVSVSGK